MRRVRVGVIGAGGIAQIEHVPNLIRLKDRFELVGVADPSATARAFIAEEHGVAVFETVEALLVERLEAVVISSPDPLHLAHMLGAFLCGCHVFCEKPLCYAPEDIDRVIAARNRAGKVLQVGYMKRFDPSYAAAQAAMPGSAETLRYVSVEVNDPDAWPFVRHHRHRRGDDVPAALIAAARESRARQVRRAVGPRLDPVVFAGFVNAYCSALVHDVNAVHGLLDAMGVPEGEITGANLFAGGAGGQGTVRLLGGRALWNMVHLTVPGLPDYRERITFYFDDALLELEFPSPWLNHFPTKLTVRTSEGHTLKRTEIVGGYEEAFVEEVKGFWAAVVEGAPVVNTAEAARRDQALLCGMARVAAR